MAGWGDFFGKISQYFQGRIERLKNEKNKILAERKTILSLPYTDERGARLLILDNRLSEVNAILNTKASD